MSEGFVEGAFLGLAPVAGEADMTVVPLAYELTTSYGTGAVDGPKACIEASAQVELYDDLLGEDLPAGSVLHTAPVWEGTASTLRGQLDELADHAATFYSGQQFPLFLGGEHGILPPLMHAARGHPLVDGDLSKVTVVQLDAHADLRSSLDDEVFSHACAAARSLDVGVGALYQAGIRAYSLEEAERIARRVMGGAHPLTVKIEHALPKARAALAAREGGDVSALCDGVDAMTPGCA